MISSNLDHLDQLQKPFAKTLTFTGVEGSGLQHLLEGQNSTHRSH